MVLNDNIFSNVACRHIIEVYREHTLSTEEFGKYSNFYGISAHQRNFVENMNRRKSYVQLLWT